MDDGTADERPASTDKPDPADHVQQPDADASSDGDGSWTDDPVTADPDEDRSVEAVIEKGRER